MTTKRPDVLDALRETGAILSGHFQLTSGRHSDTYVQCARVLEYPRLTAELGRHIAEQVTEQEVDLVASPAVGGIVIGFAVAQALDVRFIFSERQQGVMTFRRGFAVTPGERALIVEDVVTTGGSVAEVAALVRAAGGVVVGVGSIIDRGGDKAFADPFFPLFQLNVESMEPHECPQCQAGVPLSSPGSRRLS